MTIDRTALRRAVLAAVLLHVIPAAAHAQVRPALIFRGAPEASWIAPPRLPAESLVVFHARRTFDLASKPARFVVHVSADSRYRLYVNGEQVSSGPQRSDVMHWRYETVDLAPRLRAGGNTIAAVVWSWGARHPVAQHGHRPAFLLQGDGPSEAVANTGAGWKLYRDSAYAEVRVTPQDVRSAYYAATQGESVDGARYPWGWERADFADAGWLTVPGVAPRDAAPSGPSPVIGPIHLHAVPGKGGYGDASGWQLEPRDIPPMEERPIRFAAVRNAVGIASMDGFIKGAGDLVVPANARASLVLDHARTTNAYAVVETSGGAASTLTLTYAEAAIDSAGHKGNRNEVAGRTIIGIHDRFRLDGGDHRRYQTLYWRSGRYVKLDIETGAEPLRIHD
ncbi:MAG: alpha-L-rhamnosidase N-terminal domain-containing protein, partial [Gemmatimonadaceae bacterium]